MENPWATATERANKFIRMDRNLARELASLSKHQAHDEKLAAAIESGGVYSLRQQRYDMKLRRELSRDWERPPVEQPW